MSEVRQTSDQRSDQRSDLGDGVLTRAAMAVYTVLAVEFGLVVGLAPGLVGLALLARDVSNLPLVAVAAVPVGPAVSAALVVLHRPRELADLRPVTEFARAYRRNAAAVLRLWVPMLVILTVVGINLAHPEAAGVPAVWRVLLVGVGVGVLVWGITGLVVASFFTFRTREVARLAWFLAARVPSAGLGTAAVLVLAATVLVAGSEAVLVLFGAVFCVVLLAVNRPLIDVVTRDFTE